MMRSSIAAAHALTVALCVAAAGCGGGGGGGGTTTPTPTPGQPLTNAELRVSPVVTIPADDADYNARRAAAENHPDYEVQYSVVVNVPGDPAMTINIDDQHLAQINAAAAYARGATGAGEVLLLQDEGVFTGHREFDRAGKITTEGTFTRRPLHGTQTAAVAVGRRDDTAVDTAAGDCHFAFGVGGGLVGVNCNMHGVAFDADIHVRQRQLRGPADPGAFNLDQFYAQWIRPLIECTDGHARCREGRVINYSWNVPDAIPDEPELRANYPDIIAALAQDGGVDSRGNPFADRDPADKRIIVWAAGNNGGESPELFAAFGAHLDEVYRHNIAVVAVDQDGVIPDFSNRCGVAKRSCIAAPGVGIVTALSDRRENYFDADGTSFAAPVVSGALLVLRQFFRGQIDGVALADRLFATADRRGIYADSDTYGHGLVDLDAATSPVFTGNDGTRVRSLMTGLPGSTGNRPLAGGFAVSGGAFGGALGDALAGVSVAGFDALGAPFFVPAAAMVSQARRRDDADTTVDIPLAAGAAVTDNRAVAVGDAHVRPVGVGALRPDDETPVTGGTIPKSSFPRKRESRTNNSAQPTEPSPRLSLTVDAAGAVTAARYQTAAGWWLGYADDAGRELGLSSSASPLINESFAAPYLSLVRDGPAVGKRGDRLGFALLHGAPRFDGYADPVSGHGASSGERGLGVVVDWRVGDTLIDGGGDTDFSLQAGVVSEPDGVLGARATDAFGDLTGETAFVGVQGAWVVGGGGVGGGGGYRHGGVVGSHGGGGHGGGVGDGWRLAASAFIGNTRADAGDGFVSGVGGVTSDAFAVTAARGGLWRRGDRLDLAVTQPLRVADGDLTLTLPAGRTRYGEVIRRRHRLNLAPAGRAVRVGAVYQTPAAAGVVTTTVAVTRHPDHDPDADDEALVKVSFSKSF